MLKRLSIKNYALIESLDIEFPDGLVIITGETGAGKSILLGAVSLLLCGKADATVIKQNTQNCVVEGEFTDHILRRVISPSGRSRFFIDDNPATAAEMAQVAGSLIDIHAQHKQLLLGENDFQMEVLDFYSSNGALLKEYKVLYQRVGELKRKIEELKGAIARENSEREFREFQIARLVDANLQNGELESLEEEQHRLAFAEEIKRACLSVEEILYGGEESVVHKIKESQQQLEGVIKIVPQFDDFIRRLESIRIECKDIAEALSSSGEEITISPGRLAEVEERMSTLYSLLKRFNASDIAGLIKIRDDLISKEESSSKSEEELKSLEEERVSSEKRLKELAEQLSKNRKCFAPSLASKMEEEIRGMEMPFARFDVEVSTEEKFTQNGCDRVRFLFDANGTGRLVDLQSVASGGELSRMMLSLKRILAQYTKMPTMIFDEIDVGISGSIADKMGQVLSDMGRHMQIFAITHLPQVASKGTSHILVYKEFDGNGKAATKLKFIQGDERLMEIARLLSGEQTTTQAIENARVLLDGSSE